MTVVTPYIYPLVMDLAPVGLHIMFTSTHINVLLLPAIFFPLVILCNTSSKFFVKSYTCCNEGQVLPCKAYVFHTESDCEVPGLMFLKLPLYSKPRSAIVIQVAKDVVSQLLLCEHGPSKVLSTA